MKKTLLSSLIATTVFLGSTGVQAAMITQWQVGVDTVFDTTLGSSLVWDGSNGGTPFDHSASPLLLSWGQSTGDGQSSLGIGSTPINTTVNTNGAAVNNVTITHTNNPITGTTLDRVNILSTLTLTPLVPELPGLPPTTMTFTVNFQETTNASNPCADGGANGVGVNINGCADIFVIDKNSLNFAFQYYDSEIDADRTYYISFFEATNGLHSLSQEACSAAGGGYPCLGFETSEGMATTAQFAALITSEPVSIPEPGILALLGVSLAGLGMARRRKA